MPVKKPGPGDDLLRLAQKEGVSLRAILDHPDNRDLFACRDSGVLHEDDELFVPPAEPKRVQVSTGYTHYLVYKPPRRTLHLELRDESGKPRQVDYTLQEFEYDGELPKFGPKPADKLCGFAYQGIVHEELPAATRRLKLVLEDEPDDPLTLELGRLDPVSTTRGLKARLQSLGLFVGDVASTAYDFELAEAVRLFQARQGLPVTGDADPAMRAKLKTVCGG